MNPCSYCGRSRRKEASRPRCACVPVEVWHEPEMITAVQQLDIVTVVRILRAHPRTRNLSQTAPARLTGKSQATISEWESGKQKNPKTQQVADVLEALGAPGYRWGSSWVLPEEVAAEAVATPEVWEEAQAVVITVPVPVQIRTADNFAEGPQPVATLVADTDGLLLVVGNCTTWAAEGRDGRHTIRIALA